MKLRHLLATVSIGMSITITLILFTSAGEAAPDQPDANCRAAPPIAVDDFYAVHADTTLVARPPGVLVNDVDPDGDLLATTLQSGPDSGTLSLADDGSFVYTPTMSFNGIDAFTYVVTDGVLTDTATVEILVSGELLCQPIQGDEYTILLDRFTNVIPREEVTPHGSPALTQSLPGLGTAADMITGTFSIYDTPSIESQGTIEMWINPEDDANLFHINWFDQPTQPGSGKVLHFRLRDGEIRYSTWNDDPNQSGQLTSDPIIAPGQWTHLAVSWGPSGTRLYADGQVVTSTSEIFAPDIPGVGYSYLNYWGDAALGVVDELHVSDVQRTDSEIAAHATGQPIQPDAHTVILDHFDFIAEYAIEPHGTARNAGSLPGLNRATEMITDTFTIYHSPWDIESQGTIEMWIKPDSDRNLFNINWDYAMSNPGAGFVIKLQLQDGGRIRYVSWNIANGVGVLRSSPVISYHQWNHIAASWGPSGTRIYANGEVVTSTPDLLSPSIDPATFGYLNYWGEAPLSMVDEFHVSNIQRSDAEIRNHAACRPLAIPDRYELERDTTLSVPAAGIQENDADVFGRPLTTTLLSSVAHGDLDLELDGSFVYTPTSSLWGRDVFTYTLSNGSQVATGRVDLIVIGQIYLPLVLKE